MTYLIKKITTDHELWLCNIISEHQSHYGLEKKDAMAIRTLKKARQYVKSKKGTFNIMNENGKEMKI